jgi:hypothetical protein
VFSFLELHNCDLTIVLKFASVTRWLVVTITMQASCAASKELGLLLVDTKFERTADKEPVHFSFLFVACS